MTKKSKLMCANCRDNYYNHNVKDGCWCYKKAKVVKRTLVGYWQEPPYKWRPQETLDCHSPEGYAWIKKDDPRIE